MEKALSFRFVLLHFRLIFMWTHKEDKKGFYPLEEMVYARILTIRFLLGGMKSHGTGKMKPTGNARGEVYLRQFDGRCIKRLAFSYGNRLKDFKAVMEHIQAVPVNHGDLAYEIEIYPDYQVQMILWEGDDEFRLRLRFCFQITFRYPFRQRIWL